MLGYVFFLDWNTKIPTLGVAVRDDLRRRIAIIRALSRDFDILILDEAFNGIDRENIEKIAQIINENTKDKTLVMVSHSEWEAEILRAKIVKI